jgi:kynurenine formamidase
VRKGLLPSRLTVGAVLIANFAALNAHSQLQSVPPPASQARATKQQLERWLTELSNRGRWGKDDERGALNLITAAKRRDAAALVKTGEVISLARDLAREKAFTVQVVVSPDGTASETHTIRYHSTDFTHLDSLCHVSHDDRIYNDFSFRETVSNTGGCTKAGLGPLAAGILTRAVLLDIPRLKGVPYLEPGTSIYAEDIEAWEKLAGIKISAGDAILLHTGRWLHRRQFGASPRMSGFDPSVAPLLKARDVALIGADGNGDVNARGLVPGFDFAFKKMALVVLGAPLLNALDLEQLAATAAKQNRWEFMLIVAPTPVSVSTGSIINPVAVF